jgi:hypothetical protein
MNYSIEKINTLAGCDLLVASAQKKKLMLERKRRNLGESIEAFSKRLDQLIRDLAEVQIVLTAYTNAYHALPEGCKYKASMNVEVKRLELRKARLEKRAFTCNVQALLSKQLRYNKLDAQVSAIESYITLVENKKTVLGQAILRVTYTAPALRPPVRLKSRFEKKVYKLISQKMANQFDTGRYLDGADGMLTDFIRRRESNPFTSSSVAKKASP